MWWDDDSIRTGVTRELVCSHLLPEEIARLDRPLAFGGGLTDGTYWEWIDEKAKKIFLILVDLGCPDQIFGVVDDSWDDGDLPIALDHVGRLALTAARDERLERRFYQRQFHYLLKPLRRGEHAVYQDVEVVPLDVVPEKQGRLNQNQGVDRVVLPGEPGVVFCRRRIPMGSGPGCLSHEDFRYEVDGTRAVQNDHLVSYWASYVHQGHGYVLFTPAGDLTIKSLLAATPASIKNMDKAARRRVVLDWVHCLADTLCYVHSRGLSHGNIKPSTVFLGADHHIFYSDFTRLSAELLGGPPADKTSFDKESYDYAAPEQWFRPQALSGGAPQRKATLSALSASPDRTTFAISRGGLPDGAGGAALGLATPNPQLNPQAADVFSLGCLLLELLSFLLKRPTRAFAAHRAARHKSPGRGGAVLDSSFHRNLGQVESWMAALAREAAKRDEPGVAPMLHVVERMLALYPSERPSAHDVQTRLYQILRDDCAISEPHCVHRYGGWGYGVGALKMGGPASPTTPDGDDVFVVGGPGSRRHSGGFYGSSAGSVYRGHARHDSFGRRPESRDYFTERPAAPQPYPGSAAGSISGRELVGAFQALGLRRGGDRGRGAWQAPVAGEFAPDRGSSGTDG